MKTVRQAGFTIIELFVAVALLGVIVTMAAPSFASFVERQRISAQAEIISVTLSTARAEAMSRLATVNVCWNQTSGVVTVNSFDMQPGQMVVLIGNPAEVIRDVSLSDDGIFIDDTDLDDCVSFNSSGRFNTASATGGVLAFGVCKESGVATDSKGVVLNATGRASTVNNSDGSVINCS